MMWLSRGATGGPIPTIMAAWVLLLLGCDPNKPLPPERVCDEVGFAIANRTVTCQKDDDLAVRRYDRFEAEYSCRAGPNDQEPVDAFYSCPINIRKIPCEQVEAFDDDLDLWLLVDEVCAEFLTHADGTPIVPRDGGTFDAQGGGS